MESGSAERLSLLVEPVPQLGPAEKLRIALKLAQAGVEMKRQALIRQYPSETPEQISARMLEWQCRRVEAPYGDCPGTWLATRTRSFDCL
ncbi:MAG: hypothetical protein AB7S38_30575 [Vulcanimicrobiota bacterium]